MIQVQMIKISDVKEYDNNPRLNDDAVEAVAASILEFGFKVPIIIDKNNVIVAGHTRVKACKRLGIIEVPAIIADDLTEDQINAFRLADNKTHELALWDDAKLLEELEKIKMDMFRFGFEDLESALEVDVFDDDFDEEEFYSENPYAKRGDIFILGKHKVMCGDSTESSDVKELLGAEIIDMVFTDPPYNVDYEGTAGKIQNDKQDDSAFYDFLLKSFTNMFESIKPGGSIYVCHADTEGYNFRKSYREAGFKLAQVLIWVKNSLVLGRQDYHWRHEPILYGWKEGAAHFFVDDRTQDTIWEYNKPSSNNLHPTMKPLELVGKAINNSSKKYQLILDLFGGSGSTLIAAHQADRYARLMELDEKFVDVIVKRYLKFTEDYENSYLIRNGKKYPLSEIDDYILDEI